MKTIFLKLKKIISKIFFLTLSLVITFLYFLMCYFLPMFGTLGVFTAVIFRNNKRHFHNWSRLRFYTVFTLAFICALYGFADFDNRVRDLEQKRKSSNQIIEELRKTHPEQVKKAEKRMGKRIEF